MMVMKFTRNGDKPHVICCQRDGGTQTWMHADEFFVLHDLSHYVLEKALGYQTAFMGMLNNGMDIKDFEDREKRMRITVTLEARHAENMANLFLMEQFQGRLENFNQVCLEAFQSANPGFPAPVIGEQDVSAIRMELAKQVRAWSALQAGQTMELPFVFKKADRILP